jgi:hypothetical protein
MSPLENAIVGCLTNSFICDKPIDPLEVANFLRPRFPEKSERDLRISVTSIANGLGVRIKKEPSYAIRKRTDRACTGNRA